MHDVGPEGRQVHRDLRQPGEGPLDVGIEEEGDAGGSVQLARGLAGARVGGGIDPDGVLPGLEPAHQPTEGEPHAAHHRPVYFGEDRDPHG